MSCDDDDDFIFDTDYEEVSDEAFLAAVDELRWGRFKEILHHLEQAFDGQLSGLVDLYEKEQARRMEARRS